MISAYIGLGSNLNQPEQQILQALDELDCIPESWLVQASSLYASPPMGPQDQPDYINAVAKVHTGLKPLELLDELQRLENAHARLRSQHWGPRTLDLDLLLYGDQTIQEQRLTVPHPGIAQRAFVLAPLVEIAPRLQVPGLDAVEKLLATCTDQQTRRIQ